MAHNLNYYLGSSLLHPETEIAEKLFPTPRNTPQYSPEPYRRPVCRDTPLCEGCPYAGNGFLCRGRDGKCMRSEVARINHFEIMEEPEREDTGDIEQQE